MRFKTGLKIGLPVLTLIGAVAVVGVLQATKPELAPAAPEERSWLVSAVTARVETVQPEIVAYGEIVAVRDAELRAPIAGAIIVSSASFIDGAKVKAGEALITVDPFDYDLALGEAHAALAEAKARLAEMEAQIAAEQSSLKGDVSQLTLIERELARREKLKQGGVGTEKSIDDTRLQWSDRDEARSLRKETIKALQARADQTRAAIDRQLLEVKRAQRDLDDTTIEAPFDGYLTETSGSVGKRIAVNDKLARLVDLGSLEVRFHLSDAVYGRLVTGGQTLQQKSATVLWHSGDTAIEFAADVARIGGRVAAATGGIELYARLKPTTGELPLRPGAFVEIRLPDRRFDNAIRLPDTALHDDATVYAVEDGRLAPRQVELLARVENDVIVKGAIKSGESIVTTRFGEIGPGAKVTVR